MIVDSSALIAVLRGEPEEPAFRTLLEPSRNACISAGTLIEARILAMRLDVLNELNELMSELVIRVVPVDEQQARMATDAFARYGKERHAAGLNFGDLFAYALAKAWGDTLLFKVAISQKPT